MYPYQKKKKLDAATNRRVQSCDPTQLVKTRFTDCASWCTEYVYIYLHVSRVIFYYIFMFDKKKLKKKPVEITKIVFF